MEYRDLNSLSEGDRINMIGQTVMLTHKEVGFFVEDVFKAESYIRRLEEKFPGIRVVVKTQWPDSTLYFVRVGPPIV